MSRIIKQKTLLPPANSPVKAKRYPAYNDRFCIENIQEIDSSDKEIVALPDVRTYRSMSRAALLLTKVGLDIRDCLESIEDRFAIGLYCAVSGPPEDYPVAKGMENINLADFATEYKKLKPPKSVLKQLPNLVAAQMGICLNIMGPMYIFSDFSFGVWQALEQAEMDLSQGVVKMALVGSCFSFEDPLLTYRVRLHVPASIVLREGAGICVLGQSAEQTDWRKVLKNLSQDKQKYSYGITTDLIRVIDGGKISHE